MTTHASPQGPSEGLAAQLRALERLLPAGPLRVVLDRISKHDIAIREVDEFGMDPTFLADVAPLLDFAFERWFRARTDGLENIPTAGPAILAANHAGLLPWDAVMLAHTVRRATSGARAARPLIEDFHFYFPFLGTLLNRLGAVRACRENAERLLAAGETVAVFPEGVKGIGKVWKDRYRVQRFGRGGSVRLALATGAPLIPVAIVGPEETHPMMFRVSALARPLGLPFVPVTPTFPLLGPLGLLPLPVRWHIRFGPPLDTASVAGENAPERVRVRRLNDALRGCVQGMVNDLLEQREGIFQ